MASKAKWLIVRNNLPRILSIGSTVLIIITEVKILIQNHTAINNKGFERGGNGCGFVENSSIPKFPPDIPPKFGVFIALWTDYIIILECLFFVVAELMNRVAPSDKAKWGCGPIFYKDSTTMLGVLQCFLAVHLVGHLRTVFGAVSCLLLTLAGLINVALMGANPKTSRALKKYNEFKTRT